MTNVIPFPLPVQCRDLVANLSIPKGQEQDSIEALVLAYEKLIALGSRMAQLLQMDVDVIASRSIGPNRIGNSPEAQKMAQANDDSAHLQTMILRLSNELAILKASTLQLQERLRGS